MRLLNRILVVFGLMTVLVTGSLSVAAGNGGAHVSSMFQGPKANTGTVIHTLENGQSILRVSADFKVPDTPAPTWRIVDSNGVIYTLDAFKINPTSAVFRP